MPNTRATPIPEEWKLTDEVRIYLASSWRNAEAVKIIMDCFRRNGLTVDCFCDQEGGRTGFNIAECLEKLGHDLTEVDAITALEHPAVADKFKVAFTEDKKWLDWSNCVVMLMPCGRSAHLEAGYAKGQGKLFYIYWLNDLSKGEFDNMYQFADGMYRSDQLGMFIDELKYEAPKKLRAVADVAVAKCAPLASHYERIRVLTMVSDLYGIEARIKVEQALKEGK